MSKRGGEVRTLKTTSIKVDPQIWRAVRIRSLEEGRDTQDLVAEALLEYLKKPKKKKGGKDA